MSELSEVEIAFGQGEHHTAHETRIPEGFARRVENWDLDDNLVATTRPVLAPVVGRDAHSIWQAPQSGDVLCVQDDRLCWYVDGALVPVEDEFGDEVVTYTRDRMFYHQETSRIWYTNGRINGVILDGVAHEWGVANIVPPNRSASGGDVRFLTYVDGLGRESGAVRYDSGTPPYLPGRASRLYWSTEGSTQYRLNGDGRALETEHLLPMPPGMFLGFFAGRALVARGNRLYYSLPLNYTLCDPRYNYHTFPSRICGVGAMQSGVYVGTKKTVYFLDGTDPAAWQQRAVTNEGMIFGSGVMIASDAIPQDTFPGDSFLYAFAYLTRSGLAFGVDGGRMFEPTGDRVRLPMDTEVRMDFVARDGYYQLVAIPQQPVSPASAKAIDSPTEIGAT